jgi:3-oxoadipate enol-lactonase
MMKRKSHRALAWLAGIAVGLLCTLAAAAAPARDGKWIQANGVMLRYELTGSGGATVVLVHDMGMSLELWDEVLPALSGSRRVLRYDLRGFGLSEKFRGPVRMQDEIDDLRSLLDALHITGPVTLVGESLGGSIVLKFAAQYAERVRAVAAINPLIRIDRPPLRPILLQRDTAKLFETEGIRGYLASDIDWLYPAELRRADRVERFMGIEVAQDPQVRANYMRMDAMNVDPATELPRIHCPVLLIIGTINDSYTRQERRSQAAIIPGAQLLFIGSAHIATFESPELVGPPLRKFLNSLKK